MTGILGQRQPYVSQQLATLREAGLVTDRRDGTLIYHRLADAHLAPQVGEWARRYGVVYVPREMWEGLRPGSQELIFCIQDQGRFCPEYGLPIGRLKV